ncbi:MAG: protein kinase [Sandaracinaceae bacterium]
MDEVAGYRLDEVIEQDRLVTRYRASERDERGFEHASILHVFSCISGPEAEEALEEDLERVKALRSERLVMPERVQRTTKRAPAIETKAQRARSLPDLMSDASLSAAVVLRLAADIAEALEALHGAKLAHGLLRPLAVYVDDSGVARLADLGVGRAIFTTGSDSPAYLDAMGRFRAPEQTSGEGPSAAADRFALASMIYELLLGRPAFHAPTTLATTLKISMAKTPALDAIESLSKPAAKLLKDLFAKDPSARPAATELTQRLQKMAGREADSRRFLAEKVSPPPDEDPSNLEFAAFDLPMEDQTSLQTQLPNHMPDGGPLPLGDLSLDMPEAAPPMMDRGEPTMLARDPTMDMEDTTSRFIGEEDGDTRNEIALPSRPDSTLLLENVGADQSVAAWGEATLALDAPAEADRFAPPQRTRIVAPPPRPAAAPAPDLAAAFEEPERKPPHPALIWAGIVAGAVVVMGLVALITVLIAS